MSEKIYVLRLKGNRFYVGKTNRPIEVRVAEHRAGRGSAWTRLHKVLKVESVEETQDMFGEDNKVRELMAEKGIQNVRGGTYSQVNLEPETIEYLEKQLRHAFEECIRCGRDNHFAKDCYATTNALGNPLDETVCRRCGRDNHSSESCYAKKHVHGYALKESVIGCGGDDHFVKDPPRIQSESQKPKQQKRKSSSDSKPPSKAQKACCLRCGRDSHFAEDCYASLDVLGNPFDETVCRRCGRDNHSSGSCYASTHVHGYPLKESATGSAAAVGSRLEERNGEKPLAKKRADKKTDPRSKAIVCYRCGRGSHRADNCYASKHIDGYPLG